MHMHMHDDESGTRRGKKEVVTKDENFFDGSSCASIKNMGEGDNDMRNTPYRVNDEIGEQGSGGRSVVQCRRANQA